MFNTYRNITQQRLPVEVGGTIMLIKGQTHIEVITPVTLSKRSKMYDILLKISPNFQKTEIQMCHRTNNQLKH